MHLKAWKQLDSSEGQIDQLIEWRPRPANSTHTTAHERLQNPFYAPRLEHAAIAVEMSSALRHHSSLEGLSLINLVHQAPAAALR